MSEVSSQVKSNVNLFVDIAKEVDDIYRRLGIPLDFRYECKEIIGNGYGDRMQTVITPQYLLDNYDYNGIVDSKIATSPNIYLSLITNYTPERYNEETFAIRPKEEFLKEMQSKGFDAMSDFFRSIGYTHKRGSKLYYPFFSGYPNKDRLKVDFRYAILSERLRAYFNSKKEIEIRVQDTSTSETGKLTFEDIDSLLKFISQDGLAVFISHEGRLLIKCYVTIHGSSRVGYTNKEGSSKDMSGTFGTNVKFFK